VPRERKEREGIESWKRVKKRVAARIRVVKEKNKRKRFQRAASKSDGKTSNLE